VTVIDRGRTAAVEIQNCGAVIHTPSALLCRAASARVMNKEEKRKGERGRSFSPLFITEAKRPCIERRLVNNLRPAV